MAMTMQRVDRLLMGVHHLSQPTDEEWQRWLRLVGADAGNELRTLIEVYGAIGPSAGQRRQLAAVRSPNEMRAAVLTDSLRVRGIVTAVSWLGAPVRAFDAGHYRAAATYLELSDDELATGLEVLVRLRREAGVATAPAMVDEFP